jgi:transcriptional regulator with XRE-family HTH domain
MTKWMAAHEANPVDIHVGACIRLRRKLLGVSQDDLAAALGLTFQQVQKYERGINRVSASKLYAIAGELNVPVSFFFDGLGQSDAGSSIETQGRGVRYFLETPEGRELAQSPRQRSSSERAETARQARRRAEWLLRPRVGPSQIR